MAHVNADNGATSPTDSPTACLGAQMFGVLSSLGDLTCDEFVTRVREHLEANPSITSVQPLEVEFCVQRLGGFFEHSLDKSPEEVARGEIHNYPTLLFLPPLAFSVYAPAKNQKSFGPELTPPEQYEARWDGSTLMVFWDQDRDSPCAFSAGQVVRDLLIDTLKTLQVRCRIQGPSPVHADIKISFPATETLARVVGSDADPYEVLIELDDVRSRSAAISKAYWQTRSSAQEFYAYQSWAEHVWIIDSATWELARKLLDIQHKRSELQTLPWPRSLRDRWDSRKWRSSSRAFLVLCWMSLSELSEARDQAARAFRRYRGVAPGRHFQLIFERDLSDVDEVLSQQNDLFLGVIDFVSSRLDTRAVVAATAGGALAGGIAGALVGLL